MLKLVLLFFCCTLKGKSWIQTISPISPHCIESHPFHLIVFSIPHGFCTCRFNNSKYNIFKILVKEDTFFLFQQQAPPPPNANFHRNIQVANFQIVWWITFEKASFLSYCQFLISIKVSSLGKGECSLVSNISLTTEEEGEILLL